MPTREIKTDKIDKNKKSPIVMIFIALLIVNALVISYFFFKSSKMDKGHAESAEEESAKPLYYKFAPAFIVNIPSRNGMKFLQVEVQVMSRHESGIALVEAYAPVIKNNLIILFSSQDYDELMTISGKEKLRKETLTIIQKAVNQGSTVVVEDVLFTNFITQ